MPRKPKAPPVTNITNVATPKPCPSCGHCPTCGRSAAAPIHVYPYWGWYPYWTTITGGLTYADTTSTNLAMPFDSSVQMTGGYTFSVTE